MSTPITPRLPSSLKWTALPKDFTTKIRSVFANQFKTESTEGRFLIDGAIYPEELCIRVGYLESGRLKQINFEASMDLPKAAPAAADEDPAELTLERMYTCIDALGSLMEEYFEVGTVDEMDVPLRWKEFDFEDDAVFLQYSTVNTELEDEANRILGLAGLALVNDAESTEDAMALAEVDSELAEDVQRVIRAGKHPLQNPNSTDDDELN